MATIRMGQVLRYANPKDPKPASIDGYTNYLHAVACEGRPMALLERGINTFERKASERAPAILISSSPHKVGSEQTPWQDFFNPDMGHIRYYGDNKVGGADPTKARGNQALLEQFDLYRSSSRDVRIKAAPLVYFKRTAVGGRQKGFLRFQGFGLIERVDRLVQQDLSSQQTFSNYGFDFAVFSLFESGDEFDWDWINARRDPKTTDEECLKLAPPAWQTWVEEGHRSVRKCRRRVSKTSVVKAQEQKLPSSSREGKVLEQIYAFYQKKHRFEALAEWASERILRSNGEYHRGWITTSTGDGGADFVARLDLGRGGLACVKVVVIGQAKCESPNTPTSGRDIARTVARLRRGWIGVYVTTSYFSERVQQEVIEDKYPILLINGGRLAAEVEAARVESGFSTAVELLQSIDKHYESRIANRDPEEILIGIPPTESLSLTDQEPAKAPRLVSGAGQ